MSVKGPISSFTHAAVERRAKIVLHETIKAKPKAKHKHVSQPGTYAEPKPEGAALPRTTYRFDDLQPRPHQYVRDGGNDFLQHQSKGYPC